MIRNKKQEFRGFMEQTIHKLKNYDRILFLTTSNRWQGEENEKPKSTQLAYEIAKKINHTKITVIEVPKLKIYPCEGNISTERGNTCGVLKALLDDKEKNPSGNHRCWASINNQDDELWKISKQLLQSDCVVFFGSIRWGQMNAEYQKLIERLTWLENRHTTLQEDNIIKNINAGIIIISQNWNGENVLRTQKKVLQYYGFKVPKELSWNWQFSNENDEESNDSYIRAAKTFKQTFLEK